MLNFSYWGENEIKHFSQKALDPTDNNLKSTDASKLMIMLTCAAYHSFKWPTAHFDLCPSIKDWPYWWFCSAEKKIINNNFNNTTEWEVGKRFRVFSVIFSHASGVALGMAMSVDRSLDHFGPDWNISTTTVLDGTAIKFVFMVPWWWILITLVNLWLLL